MTRVELQICETCRWGWGFYEEEGENGMGTCHRYAPRPLKHLSAAIWPAVNANDGCGEWKTRYISDNE